MLRVDLPNQGHDRTGPDAHAYAYADTYPDADADADANSDSDAESKSNADAAAIRRLLAWVLEEQFGQAWRKRLADTNEHKAE